MRNCTLTGNQLFQDILSYNLSLIGCSEVSSDEDISDSTGELTMTWSSVTLHGICILKRCRGTCILKTI